MRPMFTFLRTLMISLGVFCACLQARATDHPDWTTPLPPFQIADDLYYVGSRDLAAYLITTPAGNILINANLESSPPLIRASVEKLGFSWADVKILLNSQAHYDHMGGAAEIVHETNAKNMVMDGDVSVVETGARTDFLAPSSNVPGYAPIHVDRVLHDGDTVTIGGVTVTAHKTAGHTRGCTTWTLRSHIPGEPAGKMRNIVIVGGVGFWSEYHFVASSGHSVSYPGIVQDFRHTFATLHSLPCDVFLGAHGGYFDMLTKLERYPQNGPRVFIDAAGYKDLVTDAQKTFEQALAQQKTASTHGLRSSESDWPNYGNDPGGMRHSTLSEINRDNVSKLKVAWVYHTGDISNGHDGRKRSGFETTPILVDGKLYLTTPFNRVIALDPLTGKQIWAYDPKIDQSLNYGDGLINRGVATWLDVSSPTGKVCKRRIFESTLDARLIALDALTGVPCPGFGSSGQVNLGNVPGYQSGGSGEHMRGWYHMTSPPVTVDDMVIVGSSIDDNARADMPSGVVRAFDARTGSLRWSWDPLPRNTSGSISPWVTGAANAWSIMAVDPVRDLVFVPTGSASPDYYGGLRPGDDKWANSVVALHAKSGRIAWGFQLVHHDLWDYDTASPPLLATVPHDGQNIPVVIQGNKTGFLYVLNRNNGKPIFPVEERAVPQSDVLGERASPTQPIPLAPPPLAPQHVSADDAWGPTPADREACREAMQKLRNEGIFTPPSVQGTLVAPGNLGGMNWSGYSYDPRHNLLIVNTNSLIGRVRLIPRDKANSDTEDGDYALQRGTPYGMLRRFLQSPSDLPCGTPPWGTLTAVDMAKGTIRWRVPLGSMQEFGGAHEAVPPGSISLGGPITTEGGLIFIAGTTDSRIRAFNVETGEELWNAILPAAGHATPMTYEVNGKQYLVIAAGGHPGLSEESLGDTLVGFALP